jgi:hypothetical protein
MEPNQITAFAAAFAQAFAQANGGEALRTKAVSSTPRSSGYAHGIGGLMSAPGMSREVINAMILPFAGLASRLPSRASNETHPLYGIITGQTAGSGSNPTGVCDDPPSAGLLKLCSQSYVFGRVSLQTPVIDIDRVGQRTNRGEFADYQLVGNPFSPPGVADAAPGQSTAMQQALQNETAKVMFELAVDWLRRYGGLLYSGNPANNTSGGGYKEFRGLDGLINTGYRDAETNQACAAADSLIANFASANVSNQNTNIITLMTSVFRRLKLNARGMGLMPVKWVIVMRETLFYELTQIWPCAYATYRCAGTGAGFSSTQINNIDNADMIRLRQDMRGNMENRTGQYLLIDDERVEVVFDDFVTETALANGAFNSDIYFVPLTVIGNRPVTYMEFFDYDAPGASIDAARALGYTTDYWTEDGGRYLWHKKPPTNFCIQALVKSEPRLILRTPQLAARIRNIGYTPLQHERDWSTSGYYFTNGGRTDRLGYGPSFFSPNTNVS